MKSFCATLALLSLRASVMADSGYSAPSSAYHAPSSGYGAPSSGYGAPSAGYGAPSYGAPSYGAPSTTAAAGGGGLGALLPALALGGLGLLGLAALTLPVTTTLTTGRKRRAAGVNGTSLEEANLLSSYLTVHGFQQNINFDLQKEMIASYLECGGQGRSAEMSSCLQRLVCNYHDKSLRLEAEDRDVASIIIRTIMDNKFISKEYKHVLLAAGRRGSNKSGSCHVYECTNNAFLSG